MLATRRNIPMFSYRQRHGLTQAQAGARAGIDQNIWSALECMKFVHKKWYAASCVALLLEVDQKAIIPPKCRQEIVFIDLDANEFRKIETSQLVSCDEMADPLHQVNAAELASQIEKVLRTLTYREREIIKLRYGLNNGHDYTLREVGRVFKVNYERIRQVEAKAIRKLQHPVRVAKLEGFIDLEKPRKPQIVVRYGRPTSHVVQKLGLRWKASIDGHYRWGRNSEEALASLLELLSEKGQPSKRL